MKYFPNPDLLKWKLKQLFHFYAIMRVTVGFWFNDFLGILFLTGRFVEDRYFFWYSVIIFERHLKLYEKLLLSSVNNFITLSIFMNLAGLPVIMLCLDCFCCRCLPASSLEHWWPPYDICMHGMHGLATLHPSSSRGM